MNTGPQHPRDNFILLPHPLIQRTFKSLFKRIHPAPSVYPFPQKGSEIGPLRKCTGDRIHSFEKGYCFACCEDTVYDMQHEARGGDCVGVVVGVFDQVVGEVVGRWVWGRGDEEVGVDRSIEIALCHPCVEGP